MPDRSSYDPIAGMYDSFWADWYLPAALPALETLFFSRVPPASHVLDVCCGSGHVTRELVSRGYQVTGVDLSSELISIARERLPAQEFLVQDARCLKLARHVDAALSTFDSLNHMLTLSDLRDTFASVRNALTPGGLFVFDMNVEEAYFAEWRQWTAFVESSSVGLVRGKYEATSRSARTELIWFLKRNGRNEWERRDTVVEQQCYSEAEITAALAQAGFSGIAATPAYEAGVTAELGVGRTFFSALA